MQSDQRNFPQNRGRPPLVDQVGSGYSPDPPISSFFGQNVDFQPTRDCPRNFVIFDRTDCHSQIMYNPSTASNFGYHPFFQDTPLAQKDGIAPGEEDSADIDVLLSFEDEDDYEDDTSDTCDSKGSERKRDKMRKMVKSLRGIVPGGNGNGMSTVAVLDEAVKYLKSLKVEAQKIGLGNLKH